MALTFENRYTQLMKLLLALALALLPLPVTADPAADPVAEPAAQQHIQRREAALMGTQFRITVSGATSAEVDAAAHAAFTEVARIEALMSEWRSDSEISAINQSAGASPVKVGPETFLVVQRAVELAELSGGAFDPTWAALKGLWDFQAQPPRLPATEEIEARLARTGWHKVKLDPKARTILLTEPGMALGLGGIAKGYAIDRAAAILKQRGLTRFIVDGGGDLYVSGRKLSGQPWTLGVQNPRKPGDLLAALPLTDAAMVTSGDYERFFVLDGKRYHHIIDLRTGYPATRSRSVTVQAAEAMMADALSTAIFILGPVDGVALASKLPGVEAAVVGADGSVSTTEALAPAFDKARRDRR